MNAFELAASYYKPSRPVRQVQAVKAVTGQYAVQEGEDVIYEGTSWHTATQLFTRRVRPKPSVGVLLLVNGNVCRRYVPRPELS